MPLPSSSKQGSGKWELRMVSITEKQDEDKLPAHRESDAERILEILDNAIFSSDEFVEACKMPMLQLRAALRYLNEEGYVGRLPDGSICSSGVQDWYGKVAERYNVTEGSITASAMIQFFEITRHVERHKNRFELILKYLGSNDSRLNIKSASQIQNAEENLRPPVVDGLFRIGDVANIVGATKEGKSFFALGLAMAVAKGEQWLGFNTNEGNVLIIDNELHSTDLDARISDVADANGIDVASLDGRLGYGLSAWENQRPERDGPAF